MNNPFYVKSMAELREEVKDIRATLRLMNQSILLITDASGRLAKIVREIEKRLQEVERNG